MTHGAKATFKKSNDACKFLLQIESSVALIQHKIESLSSVTGLNIKLDDKEQEH